MFVHALSIKKNQRRDSYIYEKTWHFVLRKQKKNSNIVLLIQFTIKYKSLVHYSFCFKNDFRDQDMNHFTSIFLTVLQAVVNIFGFIVETKQSYVSMRAVSLAAWFLPIIKKRRKKKLKPCKGCGGEKKESCFSSHLKGDRNETLLQIFFFFFKRKGTIKQK